jgi:hypothetical protein
MNKFENDVDAKDWLDAELADMLDEDYELELSEPALRGEIRPRQIEVDAVYRSGSTEAMELK